MINIYLIRITPAQQTIKSMSMFLIETKREIGLIYRIICRVHIRTYKGFLVNLQYDGRLTLRNVGWQLMEEEVPS